MTRHIVCICGSGRFWDEILQAASELTLKGHIVLQPNFNSKGERVIRPLDKDRLDRLHLEKITMAHEVFVVNKGGYIGESTANEIRHALTIGRRVTFLDAETGNAWVKANVDTSGAAPVLRPTTAVNAPAKGQLDSDDPDYRGPCSVCGLSLRAGQEHHHGAGTCVSNARVSELSAARHLAASMHREGAQLLEDVCVLLEQCEVAWGVIANVNGGDWKPTPSDWREAAEKWRDRWHEILTSPIMEKTKAQRAYRQLQERVARVVESARTRDIKNLQGELEAIQDLLRQAWPAPKETVA